MYSGNQNYNAHPLQCTMIGMSEQVTKLKNIASNFETWLIKVQWKF